MKLVKVYEAAKLLGLSVYELRSGIQEGRYPGFWTRNRKRLFVDVDTLQECIRVEMMNLQNEARAVGNEMNSHLSR